MKNFHRGWLLLPALVLTLLLTPLFGTTVLACDREDTIGPVAAGKGMPRYAFFNRQSNEEEPAAKEPAREEVASVTENDTEEPAPAIENEANGKETSHSHGIGWLAPQQGACKLSLQANNLTGKILPRILRSWFGTADTGGVHRCECGSDKKETPKVDDRRCPTGSAMHAEGDPQGVEDLAAVTHIAAIRDLRRAILFADGRSQKSYPVQTWQHSVNRSGPATTFTSSQGLLLFVPNTYQAAGEQVISHFVPIVDGSSTVTGTDGIESIKAAEFRKHTLNPERPAMRGSHENGEKVGLVRVRLFRPFTDGKGIAALPKAVLDCTKGSGTQVELLSLNTVSDNAKWVFVVGVAMPQKEGQTSDANFAPGLYTVISQLSLPADDMGDMTSRNGNRRYKTMDGNHAAAHISYAYTETAYARLVARRFGDRAYASNTAGHFSPWSIPAVILLHTVGKDGRSPAWVNSRFENNAGHGLGMYTAQQVIREGLNNQNYLSKKSVWIFGGDGWAYDIGLGVVEHVLTSGTDINIMVFDTEVYSNTGGQASKASNIGQVAQFTAAGKEVKKKNLAEIAIPYGYPYVAQVVMGADESQPADAYNGPSLIICYAPCVDLNFRNGAAGNRAKTNDFAVKTGYWHLYRYSPADCEV